MALPPVPSINAMYFTTKFGKRIRTQKAKDWFALAEGRITEAMKEQGWKTTEETKVIVEVHTHWPDKRRRDTNNSSKALCDALEHAGVYDDDRYALVRYIDYDVDREDPRVELVIRVYDAEKDGWKYPAQHYKEINE